MRLKIMKNVLNYSQFIGLQAELARKKEEIRNKTQDVSRKPTKLSLKNDVKEAPASKPVKKGPALEEVEDSVLQHSQNALIAKSQLYEKLRNKELVVDDSERFLVNFDDDRNAKEDDRDSFSDHNSDPEEDWVEYTDTLGRSRTCLRKDLPYYKELNEDLTPKEKPPEPPQEVNFVKQSEELELWYKRREEMRQKWEEEEKILSHKRDIHYQDVLFDEARTHGVGYYSFSQDETERQRQQEELKKMREETEKNQRLNMSIKERRDKQMKQRLEAAKKRKRERLGLPPGAELEDETPLDFEKLNEPAKDKAEEKDEMAKKVEEYLANLKRAEHIRPWDVGKSGLNPPVMSQDQWNEKQRAKREKDFAPPSSYKKEEIIPEQDNSAGLYFTSKKPKFFKNKLPEKRVPIDVEYSVEEIPIPPQPRGQGAEIPPPTSYDKSTKPKPKKLDVADAIEAGLNFLRNEAERKAAKKPRPCFDV